MSIESLIIDPHLNGRLRIKQASQLLSTRVTVSSSSTLREGLERLNSDKCFDVVFVSSQFDSAVVQNFLVSAKSTKNGERAAYMMVLPEALGEMNKIATYSLAGVDGFLLSPFSAESFEKSLEIAAAKKYKLSGSQRGAALEIIVRSLFAGLKAVRNAPKKGFTNRRMRKTLEELSLLVQGLPVEEQIKYFELMVRYAINAEPNYRKRAATTARVAPMKRIYRVSTSY